MKSLRPNLLSCLLVAPALIAGMSPDRALGAHALSQPIVGQITASPSSTEIEVNHHPYHIKAHSPAEDASRALSVGQKVSLILDGPASDAKSNVIGISTAPSP
jgi:hypothetical protein